MSSINTQIGGRQLMPIFRHVKRHSNLASFFSSRTLTFIKFASILIKLMTSILAQLFHKLHRGASGHRLATTRKKIYIKNLLYFTFPHQFLLFFDVNQNTISNFPCKLSRNRAGIRCDEQHTNIFHIKIRLVFCSIYIGNLVMF